MLGRGRGPEETAEQMARTLEEAIAAHRERRWGEAEAAFRRVIASPATTAHDREVARNIYGNLLELTRRVDEAVDVYAANVAEGVVGSYAYERLAAIYRRRGDVNAETEVLSQAVAVTERALAAGRAELAEPLNRLRRLLAEARAGATGS
jgi:hypothetical protein